MHSRKTRGGCAGDLKTLLTGDWQERAGVKRKLVTIGYALAAVSRTAAPPTLAGQLDQDRRGELMNSDELPLTDTVSGVRYHVRFE
jgi:hypothetical protein